MYTPLRFIDYNIDCQVYKLQYLQYGKRGTHEGDYSGDSRGCL